MDVNLKALVEIQIMRVYLVRERNDPVGFMENLISDLDVISAGWLDILRPDLQKRQMFLDISRLRLFSPERDSRKAKRKERGQERRLPAPPLASSWFQHTYYAKSQTLNHIVSSRLKTFY